MTPAELKARRDALGLSQPQLAALLHTSVWNLRQWEQERRRIPGIVEPALLWIEHCAKKEIAR